MFDFRNISFSFPEPELIPCLDPIYTGRLLFRNYWLQRSLPSKLIVRIAPNPAKWQWRLTFTDDSLDQHSRIQSLFQTLYLTHIECEQYSRSGESSKLWSKDLGYCVSTDPRHVDKMLMVLFQHVSTHLLQRNPPTHCEQATRPFRLPIYGQIVRSRTLPTRHQLQGPGNWQ